MNRLLAGALRKRCQAPGAEDMERIGPRRRLVGVENARLFAFRLCGDRRNRAQSPVRDARAIPEGGIGARDAVRVEIVVLRRVGRDGQGHPRGVGYRVVEEAYARAPVAAALGVVW